MARGSASERPRWGLDRGIDVPVPLERLDLEGNPALVLRRQLVRGELVLPRRLPSTDLLRFGITRVPRRSFAALSATGSAYDGCLAAGREHLLIAENFAVAVYAKPSGVLLSSTSLAGWFPNLPDEANFVFDPRALYDMMVAPLVLGVIGIVMALGIKQVEARLLRWRPEHQRR